MLINSAIACCTADCCETAVLNNSAAVLQSGQNLPPACQPSVTHSRGIWKLSSASTTVLTSASFTTLHPLGKFDALSEHTGSNDSVANVLAPSKEGTLQIT